MTRQLSFDVVVPTVGRPTLRRLLWSLADSTGPVPERVILCDDRPSDPRALLEDDHPPPALADRITVVRSHGGGPAAARNRGWRTSSARWIAFLDDDVVVPIRWLEELHTDLATVGPHVAASQGRIRVPLPCDRPPTDWERNVAGLEAARWATADMAYRREALAALGGFDQRFPRAFREDADLGLRATSMGWRIVRGQRHVVHPVPPAGPWVSVRKQAGNADDPLMRALHGPGWRRRADVPGGRRPWHLATVAAAAAALAGTVARRPAASLTGGAVWLGLTAEFAARRIAAGPRDAREIATMLATSVAIPLVATAHWLIGVATLPRRTRRPGPQPEVPAAVLFDRDGTLVRDVPYNGDPQLVEPMPGARGALDRLRRAGVRVAVVSNQSAIGRGYLDPSDVDAVNRRIEELLGPVDVWERCPHAPDDACSCRKPRPLLIERAAERLGVSTDDCVMVGDIGSDVAAARAAGSRPILVPTEETRREEVEAAAETAPDLRGAVDLVFGIRGGSCSGRPEAAA